MHMCRIDPRRALVLVLIPVVMILAACASPRTNATSNGGPSTTATKKPTTGTHLFVSHRYHFQLSLPKDWSGVDAQAPWDGKALQGQQSPAFADFTDARTDRVFTIGAAPPERGLQLAAWRAAMVRGVLPGCVDSNPVKDATLGGEPALTWTATCPDLHPVKFAVVHGGRGYAAIFEPNGSTMNAEDMRVFNSIIQSFHFTE